MRKPAITRSAIVLAILIFLLATNASAEKRAGSFQWGESGACEGILGPGDLTQLEMEIGSPGSGDYSGCDPASSLLQDLNGYGSLGPADLSILEAWLGGVWSNDGRAGLVVALIPTVIIPIDGTTVLSVVVYDDPGLNDGDTDIRIGWGVKFRISPETTCPTAYLTGYDLGGSGAVIDADSVFAYAQLDGVASVTVTSAACTGSDIIVEVLVPSDGEAGVAGGRMPTAVFGSTVTINVLVTCDDMDNDGYYDSPGCGTAVDCDDLEPNKHPYASEICDCIDNQCPGDSGYGQVDEGCPNLDYFLMSFNGSNLLVNGGSSAIGWFDGHCVEIQLGQTAQQFQPDGVKAWVRLVNRDEDEYMANAFVIGMYCMDCYGAQFDNADVYNGETTHRIYPSCLDGNSGSPAPIQGGGFTYVEDGNFDGYESTDPWNEWGAPVHPVNIKYKPNQVLHPSLGTGSIIWDLGGQFAPYSFSATVLADWFPWNPTGADRLPGTMDDDPRYDFQDRSTYYVMLTELAENPLFSTFTKLQKRWYKNGAYVRSNILAGWGADRDKALLPVGTQFAVNVAVELPDRVESYKMGDYWQFSPYEYINQVSATLHYNPDVVMPGGSLISNEDYAAGAQTICRSYCDPNHESWDYYGNYISITSGEADGWLAVANRLSISHSFSFHAYGTVYRTIQGGKLVNKYAPPSTYYNYYLPVNHGHKGVAHFNVPVGGTLTATYYMHNYTSALFVHEGPDPAPDIPLTLWYFVVVGAGSSEFWIDTFADWSFFQWIYTGNDLIPGGKANDDWVYCWPIGSCSPATAATIIEHGTEKTNYNILQSGEGAYGYFDGFGNYIRGGVQQWPVFVVAQ